MKMQRGKRLSWLVIVLIVVLSIASACSNNSNKEKEPEEPATTNEQTKPENNNDKETNHSDFTFPENVTLEIPIYERAFEGWNVSDNYYTRWVQEEFGNKYNITVKFIPITRSSEVRDYEQLLAARKAPDIILHYDMPQALAYYGEDVLQELDLEEIARYAPTYWSNMQETIEQYGKVDGKNTFFFASRPDIDNNVTLIRQDWVEQVGMQVEELTSLEKFNEMLEKWKAAGLGVGSERLLKNNFTYSYTYRDWPIDPKERALYSDLGVADFTTEATERYLRNLNYRYHQGLIDKEFYLRDDDNKAKAEFVAGKTGMFGFYLASNTDVIDATLQNNPDAKFAVLPATASTPEGLQPQARAYWPFGLIMGINYDSSDEERQAVWLYLEWLSQPENLFFMQNGVEAENYTLDESGIAVPIEGFAGESKLSNNNNKDYWALVTESVTYSDPETTRAAHFRNWAPVGYEYLVEDLLRYYDEFAPYRTPDALFTVVLDKVNEYKADLNSLFQELYVKVVLASPDQFDQVYEAAKQTYLQSGYQEILDEKQAMIDAGNYN